MAARDPVPPLAMDQPTRTRAPALAPIARLVAEGERLRALLTDPGDTRVSESILPLFLAAVLLARGGPLVCVLPDDAQARDVADGAGWFLGDDQVGLFASRGVRWASGLEPPPHLVGERARALEVLAAGGLVCASAVGAAEGIPPEDARPESIVLRVGDQPGVDGLAERLARAGYERVAQAEERGQFAVRGGLVDVFASTGREPVRAELFGDEIESLRAFSPFTQRTLHPLDQATVYPAAERRLDAGDPVLLDRDEAARAPADLVAPLPAPDLVWQPDEVQEAAREVLGAEVELGDAIRLSQLPAGQRHAFEAQWPAVAARGLAEAERDLLAYVHGGNRVIVSFAHRGEALRTRSLLRRLDAAVVDPGEELGDEQGLVFVVSPARRGFVLRDLGLILLPDTQVFRKRPPRADLRVGRALQSFADLRTGDYVVHEDHGVGKLLGFETKTVAGITRDYLSLGFRGDDRLYVPHEQIGKVSRYVGADGHAPALSRLGGKAWQTIKSRARAGARELAGELLALYAQRQRATGIAYEADGDLIERLEASFAYEETPDQRQAIEVVKEDLEGSRPMDRLLCGDVGFGKTEVAVRAAFLVVANGKQALMLAPTTILAQQHWHTFRERYRDLPVTVEMVSRFRSSADVKRILADFAAGKVDVLIGTHRVLSRDVVPKEIGLVIVDEEQRFGVAQKELLRQLRLEVDVLALTATPIPRTLHMSLSGLRDISVIETPPLGRRPIRTYVGEYDEELVRQALVREHERGGQSFYLHNRVETIEEAAEHLRQLCPELRFLVAHGQMPERELEAHMLSFLGGDADVLVSTTIIESGLDIPEANTLVVERADALGLAQLYQIRGRVGRSDVVAHAYLFYPDGDELTPEARARLATLADHTELGSGFAIAMRDLEIRGAGELLGAEQSGHVAAIGFELYVELLGEAVAELTGTQRAIARPVRVDAQIDAYVPTDYMPAETQKIDLHRRLALAESEDELRELRAATEDRFGPLPEPVESLFAVQEAKLRLARIGADFLVFRGGRVVVGPLVLGSTELRELRSSAPIAVYSSAKREIAQRAGAFAEALDLVDAILELRLSA
jgi:transcription-repair coupling factor (superfamily II helicase)